MAIYLQPLTYDEFIEENADALTAICSESGTDRELDFDKERWCEAIYNDAHARGPSRAYPQLVFAKPRFAVKFDVAFAKMRDEAKAFRFTEWREDQKIWIDYEGDLTTSFINGLTLDFDEIRGLWLEVSLSKEERLGYSESDED